MPASTLTPASHRLLGSIPLQGNYRSGLSDEYGGVCLSIVRFDDSGYSSTYWKENSTKFSLLLPLWLSAECDFHVIFFWYKNRFFERSDKHLSKRTVRDDLKLFGDLFLVTQWVFWCGAIIWVTSSLLFESCYGKMLVTCGSSLKILPK